MSTPTPPSRPVRLDVVVLLPRSSTGTSVLARTADGLRLPTVTAEASDEEPSLSALADAVAGLLGSEPVPLRIVPLDAVGAGRSTTYLLELAPIEGLVPPAGFDWIEAGTVEPAIDPEPAGATVRRWVDERRNGPSPRRPAWSHPGWLERAGAWMTNRMARAGLTASGTPRLHYLWGLSAVVRADTDRGAAFLKACATVFRTEPRLTATLAGASPDLLPEVIATSDEDCWLLMGDLGGTLLGNEPVDRWADGLDALATIQRRWVGRDGELAAAGFEDRGLEALARRLPALIDDPAVGSLDADARRSLATALPRLIDACHALAELGPPATVVHGDFHPWNVARRDGQMVVFDWSDAAIGHPFLDLVTWVGRTPDVAARRRMVDRYVAHWSDFVPASRADEAVRLALPLGAIRQVESYRRILDSLDPDDHWDLALAGASYARRTLALLRDGLEAPLGRDGGA
ncbi:MAG TPA: aminoglycoside phosphotransferase family protein [Candidatus Limnocylindrales bacterium]|nr:aminoglycoside phosphotransferase family protein [Candidatus Limnocylindrales bacterium]